MNTFTRDSALHMLLGTAVYALVASVGVTGCAQNPDARHSWEQTDSKRVADHAAYLECVKERADSDDNHIQLNDTGGQLLIGSADPQLARGIVAVHTFKGGMRFSVYQADAWQTRGSLVNAAYACSHT